MKIKGNNVLITGGASGLGKIMGRMSLERGAAHLFIWDLNEANIAATIDDFKAAGFDAERIRGYRVDVTDVQNIERCYDEIKAEYGQVDILINCAGVCTNNKVFAEQSIRDIDLTMDINAKGSMYTALTVLKDMMPRNSGHICNIASEAGILSIPKMSLYVASKWAVIGWSDSLRIEFAKAKSKVRVTTAVPYFINTGLFEGVRSPLIPILKPEPTARKILNAIERDRSYRGIPFSYHFSRMTETILPTWLFDWFFGTVCGVYTCMDHFKGRPKQNEQIRNTADKR
ncbi:MAG: SDR family NAD(P)-dependent oxidoreductase [Bacteroidales bacterium]|nr:SDR family NAD(P)-dependent oxidoreductase [Bacteroidales bacterium]